MNMTLFANGQTQWPIMLLAAIIIIVAVWGVIRRVDVRLCLLLAALSLGVLAGDPFPVIRQFFTTFANERFVVPICCAMGFAYVLRHTGCDKHLVHLLVNPLSKVRPLLIPGTVVVGFIINTPIISQTSTVAAIGPVVIPILLAARISPLTTGAALLLGCSIGGELLNPGAPELRTIAANATVIEALPGETNITQRTVGYLLPLNMVGLATATIVFWILSLRAEKRMSHEKEVTTEDASNAAEAESFRVNYLFAFIPLVPLLLLYIVSPPLQLIEVPHWWLEENPETAPPGRFESRLIGATMLVGVILAALAVFRKAKGVPAAFFEGAGFAFTRIVSLIVTASCFGVAIRQIGIAELIGDLIQTFPGLLIPAAGVLPMLFGVISGSGMAATQSLYDFFAGPCVALGIDPTYIGAVVALGSAAGRTMSPVAAVVFMTSALTKTDPIALVRRVALPLIAGITAIIITAMIFQVPLPN